MDFEVRNKAMTVVRCGFDELADPFVDETLPATEADSFCLHLEGCAACRREVNLRKRMIVGLEAEFRSVATGLPQDFSARVVGSLESRVCGLREESERSVFLKLSVVLTAVVTVMFSIGSGAASGFADGIPPIVKGVLGTVGHFVGDFAFDSLALGAKLAGMLVPGPYGSLVGLTVAAMALAGICSRIAVRRRISRIKWH
jgi:hypothetical protein